MDFRREVALPWRNSTIGEWDTTSRFVHNLANDINEVRKVSGSSQDVNVNNSQFWCVQAIASYEGPSHVDYDGEGKLGQECGKAAHGGPGVIFLFYETMRDVIATDSAVKRNKTDLEKLIFFHETLHLFGFKDEGEPGFDPIADGDIMTNVFVRSDSFESVTELNNAQIKKIQEKDFPR